MRLTKEREEEIRYQLEMENGHGHVSELLSEIDALREELKQDPYVSKSRYLNLVEDNVELKIENEKLKESVTYYSNEFNFYFKACSEADES